MDSKQKKQPVIDKTILRFIGQTFKENPKISVFSTSSMVALGLISTAFPWVMGQVMATLVASAGGQIGTFATIAICTAHPTLQIANSFFASSARRATNLFYTKIENFIFGRNTDRTMDLPPLVQKEKTEKKLSSSVNRSSMVTRNILQQITAGTRQLTELCGSTTALALLNWPLAIVVSGLTAGKVFISTKLHKQLEKYQEEFEQKRLLFTAQNRDMLANNRRIVASGQKEQALKELKARQDELFQMNIILTQKRNNISLFNHVWDWGTAVAFLLPTLYNFFQTKDVAAYFATTGSCFLALNATSGVINTAMDLQSSHQEYKGIEKGFEYDRSLDRQIGTKELNNIKGLIEFHDISFAYPAQKEGGKGHQIFNNFNLSIQPGEHVAIIGPSGMGKSTLVSLLAHEYEIQSGQITIDGHDVRDISERSLCQNISFIEQEPTFFEQQNIEYNLKINNPEATRAEIETALKRAHLYNELNQKESFLEGSVTALSPGQRQRLALAGAFLTDCPIVILDEPTSKLDVESQRDVLQALQEFGQDKTIITISHIPAEINNASRVLILDNGRIIEDGDPHDLIQQQDSLFHTRYADYAPLFERETKLPQAETSHGTLPAPQYICSHTKTKNVLESTIESVNTFEKQ